jgi:uncharacterized protein with HEPN domain
MQGAIQQSLKDIISAGNKIEYYLRRVDYEDFRTNQLTIDYVLLHLDRISYAAVSIPPEIQQQQTMVKWANLTTLRADVTRTSGGIDVEALWKLVKKKWPRLQKGVEKALQELSEANS